MNLTCRDASRLVSESMDRKLSRWERLSLAVHLVLCSYCRRFKRQVAHLRGLIRDHFGEDSRRGARLTPQARARIRQALGNQT